MAFYRHFWDLANSTTYSSHVIGAFDRNTTTGGGIFRWVGGVNNSTITNIPGVRIKPVNAVTGYWLRSFDGPISVSWFGCQNSVSIPNTYAQLGVNQLTLDSYYGPGFATTTDNYDTTAIRYAMKFMDDMIALNATPSSGASLPVNANSLTFEPKTYYLTRMVTLPRGSNTILPPFVTNDISIIIDGNGATIKKANNNQFDFFNRYPSNPSNPNDAIEMKKASVTFKNFNADGLGGVWQGSGYSFLTLTASNNALVENLTIQNFDIGVRMEWCDSAMIQKINTTGIATNSIRTSSGSWPGATPSVGCTNLKINQVNVLDTISQSECIKVIDGAGVEIEHIVLTGTSKFDHGIYLDSGSPTLQGFNLKASKVYDVNYIQSNTNPQVTQGWNNALVTVKATSNNRYLLDTVYILYTIFPYNLSPTSIINIEETASVPGRNPIIELTNIPVYSTYPTAPTLPVNTTTGLWPTMFRNVGSTIWDFQTVDFGGDPSVNAAAIVDPTNNLWVTIAPATIPSISDLIYNNPLSACCNIQDTLAAGQDIADGLLFIGTDAGVSNTGASDVIGLGSDAASGNSGIDVVALGNSAALTNTGSDVVAIGNNALSGNTGSDAIAIGENAGQNQTGADAILIGQGAGFNNIGIEVVAIGKSAGNANTGDKLHAMGVLAGAGNTGDFVVALGSGAAVINTVNYVLALGNGAGANNAIPNSTIISNDCLPSYLNYAAASAVIIAPGATTGTYLYHDQTTNSIGAVRIP